MTNDPLRALAREVVENHDYNCAGTYIADAYYYSVAPKGHELCESCAKLATSIEAFGREVAARQREEDAQIAHQVGERLQRDHAEKWDIAGMTIAAKVYDAITSALAPLSPHDKG